MSATAAGEVRDAGRATPATAGRPRYQRHTTGAASQSGNAYTMRRK